MNWSLAIGLCACLAAARPCGAQITDVSATAQAPHLTLDQATILRALAATSADPSASGGAGALQTGVPSWASEGRACEGCPRRRLWAAYLQTSIVNVFYNIGNHARGEETAKVGPKSWWRNMKYGFEWDDNPFSTNQFGHPYQGSNYFNTGRANGLSYWESAAVTAFGSATWEYFGENNYASFNDLVNTTLGGIALGEMFHRVGWLVRDTTATGRTRLWQEIAATAIDPLTGANRFLSGDASRVTEKPATFAPATGDALGSFGVLWQGNDAGAFSSTPKVFLEMDLRYGSILSGRSREPFEAFTVDFRLGGGRGVSDVRVRGRLLGQPLGAGGKVQLTLAQSYDYVANQAYDFGRQGFDLTFSSTRQMTQRMAAVLVGGAGVTALGAVDRVVVPTPFSGEAEGPVERTYDYGPGTTFGGGVQLLFDQQRFATLSYQGYQLYVVDGVRANHVLQRLRLDLLVPLRGRLAAGVTGEFFYRKTYFQAGGEERTKFPQMRFFVAWR